MKHRKHAKILADICIIAALFVLVVVCARHLLTAAFAQQSAPNWTFNYVPTPAEWNFWFGKKVDWTGAAPCTVAGCTLTGTIYDTSTISLTDTGGATSLSGTIAPPNLSSVAQGALYNTTAGGLNLQGLGTGSDITFRNNNGTVVCNNPTGTTNLICGSLYANTATAPTLSAGQTAILGPIGGGLTLVNGSGAIYNITAGGLALQGKGSSNDVVIRNSTGSNVLQIPTGGTTTNFTGAVGSGGTSPAINGTLNLFGSTSGSASISANATGVLSLGSNVPLQSINFTDAGNGVAFIVSNAGGTIADRVVVTPSQTGSAPGISVSGTDANPNLTVDAKGAGAVKVATVSTGGFGFNVGSDATDDTYYRGSSGVLVRVPIGVNGQVYTVNGGVPSWQAAGATSGISPGGRITLTANTPVLTTTTTSTTLRYDCATSTGGTNVVPYFNGSTDNTDTIASCEVTDAMVSTASAGQVVSGNVYDLWWVHSGANRICIAMSASAGGGGGWSADTGGSNTSRGTGYSQLDFVTRPYVTNKNAISNCFNGATNYGSVSANQATYLGTVWASANGTVTYTFGAAASGGTAALLGICNPFNKHQESTAVTDNGTTYTYTGGIRQARASTGNEIQTLSCFGIEGMTVSYNQETITSAVASAFTAASIGLDTTSSFSVQRILCISIGTTANHCTGTAVYNGNPGAGLHTFAALEQSDGTNANTFNGNSTNVLNISLQN